MATIVAAAGGGNWNATGTWVGGVLPTISDDVQLTSSSGNVTLNANSLCRSLDCTGYTGTLTWSAQLTIGTSTPGTGNIALKFVSGMGFTWTAGALIFSSSSATQQTVAFAGKTSGWNVIFQTGGNWQLQDALSTTGSMQLSQGTLDCNNQSVTATQFASTGATTRTLTMGSGTFTFSTATPWTASGSNFTLNANTSTIVCSSASSPVFAGNGLTYNNVSFTGASTGATSITGANTFNNVTYNAGANKTASLTFAANQTISGTLTASGNSTTNRLLITSSTTGTTITLTVTTVTMSNVDLMDITGAGAASWNLSAITGLSGDCGGNSGITFTTPATQTWQTPTANGSWSASANWTSRVPLPQDNVVISYTTAGKTITADMPRLGHNIDFSGTSAASLTLTNSSNGRVYGNLNLTHVTTISGSVTFCAHALNTLTTGGLTSNLTVDSYGANGVQMQDNLAATSTLNLLGGTFDVNGHAFSSTAGFTASTNDWTLSLGGGSFTVTTFSSNANAPNRTINFGTNGVINLSSTLATTVLIFVGGSFSFTGSGGQIVISTASANTRTFAGGGFAFPTLAYTIANSSGTLNITGSNTFDGISLADGVTNRFMQFTAGTTTTLTSAAGWQVNGAPAGLGVGVQSITAATHTLSCPSGTVSCDYVQFTNSVATGGASWYAGVNSTDAGGNTGWQFTTPPITAHPLLLTGVGS